MTGDVLTRSLNDMWRSVVLYLPTVLVSLLILIAGYLLARLARALTAKALRRAGVDRVVRNGPAGRLLSPGAPGVTDISARLVFFVVILFALQASFGVWGPNPASDLITTLISWLPQVLVAILIVVVTAAIARAAHDLVLAVLGGLTYARVLAKAAAAVLVTLGVIAGLDQIGIATSVTRPLLITILATVAGVIIVGVGGGLIRPMQQRWERWLERAASESAVIRSQARAYAEERSRQAAEPRSGGPGPVTSAPVAGGLVPVTEASAPEAGGPEAPRPVADGLVESGVVETGVVADMGGHPTSGSGEPTLAGRFPGDAGQQGTGAGPSAVGGVLGGAGPSPAGDGAGSPAASDGCSDGSSPVTGGGTADDRGAAAGARRAGATDVAAEIRRTAGRGWPSPGGMTVAGAATGEPDGAAWAPAGEGGAGSGSRAVADHGGAGRGTPPEPDGPSPEPGEEAVTEVLADGSPGSTGDGPAALLSPAVPEEPTVALSGDTVPERAAVTGSGRPEEFTGHSGPERRNADGDTDGTPAVVAPLDDRPHMIPGFGSYDEPATDPGPAAEDDTVLLRIGDAETALLTPGVRPPRSPSSSAADPGPGSEPATRPGAGEPTALPSPGGGVVSGPSTEEEPTVFLPSEGATAGSVEADEPPPVLMAGAGAAVRPSDPDEPTAGGCGSPDDEPAGEGHRPGAPRPDNR